MANIQRNNWQIPRRTMLKGIGATMALPFLEAMAPLCAASEGSATPVRMACLFMANGVRPDKWTPTGSKNNPTLSPILSPLESLKDDILVLSGLSNKASFTGDGHYVKTAGWLTGTTITKTTGSDINANGVSIDQIAARSIGRDTKLPSLELGCERTANGVDTNVNYTRLYASHIAWKAPTAPLPCEINPRVAFDRLFRSRSKMDNMRASEEKSVLDLVNEDAKKLQKQLGEHDKQKIDEYLQSVREVERRIEHEANELRAGNNLPEDVLKRMQEIDQRISKTMGKATREEELHSMPRFNHTDHVRLMMDLMVLAFWADATRVSTFMFGNAVSGKNFSFLDGVSGGHHQLSHHKKNEKQLDQYQRINTWHVEQYGYLLDQMKKIKEGNGTLLDNSMVLFGSGIRDGNAHSPHDIPTVVAGKAGGTLKTGRHLAHKKGTPLCGLYHGMLKRVGAPVKQIGDATSELPGLG
ncbi:hypothetical protein NT6N_26370 [Oceaniferula spumae]|uniref:DUF1552 domain-containing protein n=1 Tax=Oceaniferula spumae TaxID=2979115 RepID=A0AAT9FN99_9BACT